MKNKDLKNISEMKIDEIVKKYAVPPLFCEQEIKLFSKFGKTYQNFIGERWDWDEDNFDKISELDKWKFIALCNIYWENLYEEISDNAYITTESGWKKSKDLVINELKEEIQKQKENWENLKSIIKQNIDTYNNKAEGFIMQLGAKGAEAFGEIILEKMNEIEKI